MRGLHLDAECYDHGPGVPFFLFDPLRRNYYGLTQPPQYYPDSDSSIYCALIVYIAPCFMTIVRNG